MKQRSGAASVAHRIAMRLAVKLAWRQPRLYLKLMIKLVLNHSKYFRLVQESGTQSQKSEEPYSQKIAGAERAGRRILYAIHWYELSGAELVALHYMRVAKSLGHICFCISTVPSRNPEKPAFEAHCLEALAWYELDASNDFLAFIASYIQKNQIDTIHIHHSALMYAALPELRARFANLRIIDTTHIVEYLSGGFPQLSVRYSHYIDVHNVISKGLRSVQRFLYKQQFGSELDESKFALTYCSSLTSAKIDEAWDEKLPVQVVTFYGRLTLQKQPFIFISAIEQLIQKNPLLAVEAHIYGDGELKSDLVSRISHSPFAEKIIFKGRCDDKQEVFRNSSILFLSSLNEGLSLTSFEALMHNRLVVSSNVGSQSELLSAECLVPLTPDFIARSAEYLAYFLIDHKAYLSALSECQSKLQAIRHEEISEKAINQIYS